MDDRAWPAHGGLMRATDVVGLPVVSIDGGEDLAQVQDVVYDPSRRLLIGFTLRKGGFLGGRMSSVLNAEDVVAVGPDAVMVASGEALSDRSDASTGLADREGTVQVLGTPAVTSQGQRLGVVSGVIIDTRERPCAVGYEIQESTDGGQHGPSRFVPISDQMALSADALVVPVEVLDYAGDDLDGFGRVLDSYRTANGKPQNPGSHRVGAETPGASGGPPLKEQQ